MLLLVLAWRYGFFFFSLSKILSPSLPGVLAWDSIYSRRRLFQNWFFLFPISADGRRGLFPLWDSSQSFGFYLLPSPVRRPEWGHGVQIAWPTFFLPSTAGRSWCTSFICLLTVTLWLIQTRRVVEIPYFSFLSGRSRDNIYRDHRNHKTRKTLTTF